jgi:hypothetical protein
MLRIVLLVSVAVWMAGCAGGQMNAYRLQKDAESLASFSAEGQLLSQSVFQGKTTNSYVKTHAADLGDQCANLARIVRSTHPNGRTVSGRAELERLATRTADLFSQLQAAPGNRSLARSLQRRFGRVTAKAGKLAGE